MRVFADFHHQALWHSLYLLFEKRFGWELYRSIGPEWADEGYWNVYPHPLTAEQFLGLWHTKKIPRDVHGNFLPEAERKNLHCAETEARGIYQIPDLTFGTMHRGIRLEAFKNTQFDIIISSIPQHIEPFNELIRLYQPKAKHIFQVGNRWTSLPGVNNIMASTKPFKTKVHTVFYHQEFDLNMFKYEPPIFHNIINSYIHYMQEPDLPQEMIDKLPGWEYIAYGAGMHQQLYRMQMIAEAMNRSSFTWHYKPEGDGFGHTLYNSYACGRPALIWRDHYKQCGADKLFEDGVTCIDTSNKTTEEVIEVLKEVSKPDRHKEMCEAAYRRFHDTVDFDEDFEKVKAFLEDLR